MHVYMVMKNPGTCWISGPKHNKPLKFLIFDCCSHWMASCPPHIKSCLFVCPTGTVHCSVLMSDGCPGIYRLILDWCMSNMVDLLCLLQLSLLWCDDTCLTNHNLQHFWKSMKSNHESTPLWGVLRFSSRNSSLKWVANNGEKSSHDDYMLPYILLYLH